ncbi:MAG TPA: ABC transporter permease, partial [Actinotalea sp.]|nr:ABC transporter permease [Actinotalea sp.]
SGSGLAADRLAVLVAWGLGGARAATWAMRRDPSRGRARVGRRRHRPADAVPRRGPLPSSGVLVAQVRHSLLALLRDPSAVFFAVAFPVLLVAVIPAANGGGDIDVDGRPLGGLIAVTMAVYGSAVTAYLNMPVDMVENRDRRGLDRLAGTPLPNSAMLAGRVTGAVLIGSVTLLISLAVGAALYGSGVPPTWPAAVAVLALGSACLGLLGLAVAGVIRHAQSAVGILLGTLLPLAFVSDIFIYGVTLPGPLNAVSWFLPLRHLTRAMTDITAPDPTLDPTHLLVVAAWTVVAALAVAVVYRALPRRTRSVRVGP